MSTVKDTVVKDAVANTASKSSKKASPSKNASSTPTKSVASTKDKTVKTKPNPPKTVMSESARMVRANMILIASLIIMAISNVGLVWYAISTKVEVIATSESGSIINPIPLSEAFVTEPRVLSFADECMRASFSHDFENYRRTMNAAIPCYTSSGAKELTRAIDPLLTEIKNKRVVMSITTEPAVIVRGPMMVGGRATWEVQLVMSMFFSGTKERYPTQMRIANITVVRVPIEEDPRGVAIHTIQLAPYSNKY